MRLVCFFFKQKTAYEIVSGDWSSDVCSSDLLYGDHWFARADATIPEQVRSWSETVTWRWGSHLAERANVPMRWEDTDQVPFTYYANGGTYEWLFLENARSFEAKLRLMQEKKLRGFSAWVLGLEDEEIW